MNNSLASVNILEAIFDDLIILEYTKGAEKEKHRPGW